MPKLADWVKETVSGTPGTGTITLGGAVAGFCRFQDNFVTTDKVFYAIEDGNNREEGYGTLTTGSPWTLARTTPLRTIDAGVFDNTTPSAISLTSAAIVGIAAAADTIGIVVGVASYHTSSLITCTTIIPWDDTIPQSTEGTEAFTLAYTPKFADSIIQVRASVFGTPAGASLMGLALFKDSNANALVANVNFGGTSGNTICDVYYEEVSGNTTSRTYKLRVGPHNSGTMYINGNNTGGRLYGGVGHSGMQITEIRQ